MTTEIINDLRAVAEWFREHGENTNKAVIPICERAAEHIAELQGNLDKLKLWETLLKAESHAPIIKKAKSDAVREFSKELMDIGSDGFISKWDIVDANADYQKRLKGE